MIKHAPLVLIVFLTVATRAQAAVPPWLEEAARMSVPEYEDGTPAIALLREARTLVAENGEIREIHRAAFKVLRRDGLDLAWIRLPFDNDTRISQFRGWTLKGQGVVHEVTQKDGVETQLVGGSGALFEDTKSLLVLIPQVEVGSVLAYEYERRHRPEILQDFQILQVHFPVLRAKIELQLPAGWEYKSTLLRIADQQPVETARNTWTWTFKDLAAIPREEGMPSLENISALLVTSILPPTDSRPAKGIPLRNWNDFAAWTSRLIDERAVPNSDIADLANRLNSTSALAEFVQQKIRYVAIEVGIGGYQPHAAVDTLQNQYGDCKDKVTLFRSLMKAANREVYPVLINASRGGLVSDFPSPLYFDHMIAAIPIGDSEPEHPAELRHPELGRVLLFDPTDELTPLGRISSALQGTQAVVVQGDRAFLIETPISTPAMNRLSRGGDFKIDAGGAVTGSITATYEGALAVYHSGRMKDQPSDVRQNTVTGALARVAPGSEIANYGLSALDKLDSIEEKYSITLPNYVQRTGNLLLFRPAIFELHELATREDGVRVHPYHFDDVKSHHADFTFQSPDGFVVDAVPAAAQIDLPFASFRFSVTVDGTKIRYTSRLEIKKLDVPPSDFRQSGELLGAMETANRAMVVLKRAQ